MSISYYLLAKIGVDTAENGPKVKVWSNELLALLTLSSGDLLLELLLLARRALNLLRELLHVVLQVLVLGLRGLLVRLAPVAVLDVGLLLVPQVLDHQIDVLDDLGMHSETAI